MKFHNKLTAGPKKVTFGLAIGEYNEHCSKDLSLSYRLEMKSEQNHMLDFFADSFVDNITTLDIEKYFNYLIDVKKLSPNTVIKHKSHLKNFFKFMVKDEKKIWCYNKCCE